MKKTFLILLFGVMFIMCSCGKKEESLLGDATIGERITYDFKTRIKANPDISPVDMAEALLTNESIEFKGTAIEVDKGFLNGFTNKIEGFDEAVMFAPVVGAIPFVGYIFTVEDESKVGEFMDTLRAEANPRWNVCSEADETFVEASGNMVFFLMSPMEFEE